KQLEFERALRALALPLDLLALQLEAPAVPIERLPESSDHHARETCLEMSKRAAARHELIRSIRLCRRQTAAGKVGDTEDCVDDAKPGDGHTRKPLPSIGQ